MLAKVGVEPSGEAFNEISLERDTGRPRNPMINAGAITAHSLVGPEGLDPAERVARVRDVRRGGRLGDPGRHPGEERCGRRADRRAAGTAGDATFSPRLDVHGNSVRGVSLFERFSSDTGLHLMEVPPTAPEVVRSNQVVGDGPDAIRVIQLQGGIRFAGANSDGHLHIPPWPPRARRRRAGWRECA